jgi:hypothetical protein
LSSFCKGSFKPVYIGFGQQLEFIKWQAGSFGAFCLQCFIGDVLNVVPEFQLSGYVQVGYVRMLSLALFQLKVGLHIFKRRPSDGLPHFRIFKLIVPVSLYDFFYGFLDGFLTMT